MPPDERQGKPSASAIGRLAHCTGSWGLIRRLRDLGSLTEPQSDSPQLAEEPEYLVLGNSCHEYMRFPTEERFAALSAEGQWMVKRFDELFNQAVQQLRLGNGDIIREQRLWYGDNSFSGQMDIGIVLDEVGAIFDYKSGRFVVDEADQNYQLRALAVLMAVNFGVSKVYVGVIQPRSDKPLTICEYSEEDLRNARLELESLMEAIEKPDAPLTPGDWCTFCPARAHCPALGFQVAHTIVKHHDIQLVDPTRKTKEIVDSLPVDALTQVMDMAKRGRAFFDGVEERIKALLKADPGSVPGWTLTDDVEVQSVGSAEKAWDLLEGYLEPEEFASACKVTIGRLEEVFQARYEKADTKTSNKARLRKILEPAMITSKRSGSLKKATNDQAKEVAAQTTPDGALPAVCPAPGEVPKPVRSVRKKAPKVQRGEGVETGGTGPTPDLLA